MNNFYNENKTQIFKKYDSEILLNDIRNYLSGSGKLSKVLNHFFEEEMYKCKGGRGTMSPMEVLNNDEIIEKILIFTKSKPKFYVGNDIANVKSFFRNAGRIAQKVANFPVREAWDIYKTYSEVGDTIYDMSCGFGSRMSASLLGGRNYIGTDPNTTLVERLNDYGDFLTREGILGGTLNIGNNVNYKIICQGSEIFIPELENKIDLCFSSPPYFDLEKYSDDQNQSNVKFNHYQEWLSGFAKPTIENCALYLKANGHLLINIKNMTSGKKYPLFDDWKGLCESNKQLEYIETINMKQLSKRDYKGKHFTGVNTDFGNSEPVMVFKKICSDCE